MFFKKVYGFLLLFVRVVFLFILMLVVVIEIVVVVGVFVVMIIGVVVSFVNVVLVIIFFKCEDFCFGIIFFWFLLEMVLFVCVFIKVGWFESCN